MTVKLLAEHHLKFLSIKGGCTGLSESIHVNIPHCWKSHVAAQILKMHSQLSCEASDPTFGLTTLVFFYFSDDQARS